MVNIELWKKAKKEKKLSLMDLSNLTEISISTLKDIFRGATTDPRIETVQRIEKALGLDEKEKSPPIELSEGEKALIELFNRVPADKQDLVLQMIRVALETQ
jgi:transcriptional regulator with XRE-family HTH domain